MKITKEITKSIKEEEIQDIICNKCGNSCIDSCNMNFEGLIEARICGGYASKIGDCISLTFSLCENCLIKIFKDFKHKPEEG